MKDNNYPTKEGLQKWAITLTHLFYRNGYIEELHSDKNKNLLDKDMKILNKDICDRIYTYQLAILSQDTELISSLVGWNQYFGVNWDLPKIKESMLSPENLEKLKEFEKTLK